MSAGFSPASRYEVIFDGGNVVDDSTFDNEPLEDALNGVTLHRFLADWAFDEDLIVTVIDRKTRDEAEWQNGQWTFTSWSGDAA